MKYTMYHKNLPLITFNVDEQGYVDKIFSIQNEKHIHPFLLQNGKLPSKDNYYQLWDNLTRWMEVRGIPASRKNLCSALQSLEVKSSNELAKKSFYLSLTDHYWVAPSELNLQWEKINFFNNTFSEDVGLALFGRLEKEGKINLHSPDNNTQGWLIKKWIIDSNDRFLIKGGSGPEQLEPFNEVLASEILFRLDIKHIDYKLYFENRQHYSICKNFVNENTEMITAAELCEDILDWKTGAVSYEDLKKRCEEYNIDFQEEELTKMFIVDYLVANEDRHLNNFGFLRNSETLEWIGLAPIFDTGTAMFHNLMDFELNPIGLSNQEVQCKPFNKNHLKQLSLFPTIAVLKTLDLEKLNHIGDFYRNLLKRNQRNISESKIEKLSIALDNRLMVLKEIAKGIDNPVITQFKKGEEQFNNKISHDYILKETVDFFIFSELIDKPSGK